MNFAIYNRVSTEDQSENGVSLEAMEQSCRAFITSQGGQLVKIYTDVKSGGDLNRPHLQELLRDVQTNAVPIDVILVWRLDRLSRNQVETLKLIDFLNKHKVAFRSVTEPFDTATPLGQAMLGMLSTFAQFERKSIGQRTKNAMATKATTKRMGGYAPLGYRREADGSLIPEPEEQKIITFIFLQYKSGKGLKEIAGSLNNKGITTRNGSIFRSETVRRILHNPIYTGIVIWDKEDLKINSRKQHPELIKPTVFTAIQQTLQNKQCTGKTNLITSSPIVLLSSGVQDTGQYLHL